MIKRLATPRRGNDVIRVSTRQRTAKITGVEVGAMRPGEIHNSISRQLRQWLDLHIHTNRDGTLAVAYGLEPDIWPEDDAR